jgi:lysyl endopeptidase
VTPPVNTKALKAEDRASDDQSGPYRYGTVLDADYSPRRHGTWEQLSSGQWLWRLRIQSREARTVSLGFTDFRLPAGAAVYVHGPGGSLVRGPYTNSDATQGQHWVPLVHGDEAVIELVVPPDHRAAVDLTVGKVVHGYRPLAPRTGPNAKSGACNLDVACEEADPWRKQVRSVGGYTFTRGDDQLVCTGTLVNNTAQDETPYFLTAEHCVSSASQAPSMVFYWNFENAQCREPGSEDNGTFPSDSLDVGNWAQTSSGAILRARYGSVHEDGSIAGKPDLTLVEIDDTLPLRYNLYFSGWSRAGTPPQQSTTIHHPAGHGKRISFDRDPSSLIDYPSTQTCTAPSGDTHFQVGNWEVGTTEPGSSGSPLFNENQHIVGVLSGGCAGCVGGGTNDNNRADWYGRLAPGFTNGDYQGTTLADVLDPTDSGTTTLDGQNLVDDDRPPNRVSDFRVARVRADSVTLRWTAPSDVGGEDVAGVGSYQIRYRTDGPIRTSSDFASATTVPEPPPPAAPGTEQSVAVAVEQETRYYFGIAARDYAKNTSAPTTLDEGVISVPGLRITTPPFPNPARKTASLRLAVEQTQTVQGALFDLLGRRVQTVQVSDVPPFRPVRLEIDVSGLSSGHYFLRLTGRSATRTERIVVRK